MTVLAQEPVVPLPGDIGVIADEFDLSTITTVDVIFAVGSICISILLAQLAKRGLRRLLGEVDGMPIQSGELVARIVGYAILAFGMVVALEALGFSLGPVGSLLLIAIVLLVLAARPLLQDLGASLIIQIRRPFAIGDQVALDHAEGRVDEVSSRTVRIIGVDGRRFHLPNRRVLEGTLVNLTGEGHRMSTFIAGVAYSTDLDRAREVIVGAMSDAPGVLAEPKPQAFVQEFASSTIDIACRFWHQPEIEAEWAARDEAMRAVKRAFDSAGITIAFPQRVLWTGTGQTV